MIRTLFATTALSAILVTGALAQSTTAEPADPQATKPLFSTEAQGMGDSKSGYFEADKGQILATGLIGEPVYSSTGEDAENVGDINDVVIGANGAAEAVVIGVGGFLGIGEKSVAVDFDKISWLDRDGSRWLVIETSKEELEGAPEFDRTAFAVEPAQNDQMASGTSTMTQPADGASNDMAANKQAEEGTQETAAVKPAEEGTQDTAAMKPAEEGTQDTAATKPAEDASTDTAMTAEDPAAKPAEDMSTGAVSSDTDAMAEPSARDGYTVMAAGKLSADELLGTRVYGADDSDLGEIGDVIVTADGKVEAYIIDVGGFLGIGEKPVALDAAELEVLQDENGNLRIFTGFTEDQLKTQTAYNEDAYRNDPNSVMLR